MPVIPEFGRQRKVDLFEFKGSLVFRVSSRTVTATEKNPVLKNKLTRKEYIF